MTVLRWSAGLADRWLDLQPSPAGKRRLIPFGAFVTEVTWRRLAPEPRPYFPECTEAEESIEGSRAITKFVKSLGGASAAAKLGVELFHAPVFSFRSRRLRTAILHARQASEADPLECDCSRVPTPPAVGDKWAADPLFHLIE